MAIVDGKGLLPVVRGWEMKKYLSALFAALPLLVVMTEAAQAQELIYRVGFNCQMAPFQFVDTAGSAQGMHIDIMEEISKGAGFSCEFVPYYSDSACIQALQAGSVDLVLGVNTNIQIEDGVSQIEGLSSASLCTVVPVDVAAKLNTTADYKRIRASFEYRTISYSYLRELGVTSFVAYGNQDMLYQALLDGSAPLAIGIKECIVYRLDQDGFADDYKILHDYITSIDFGILVHSSDRRLQRQVDEGLASLRTGGQYEDIYRAWITDPTIQAVQERLASLSKLIFLVLLSAGIVIFLISLFNRSLKRLVNQQTVELTQVNQQLACRLQQLSAESRLRSSVIRYSPNSMVVFDQDFKITLLNEPAGKMFGIPVQRAPGLDVRQLPVIGDILHADGVVAYLLSQECTQIQPREIQLGNGAPQIYRYSICRVARESVLVSIEDVTSERKQLHEMFEAKKNQQLNRMAAAIAHEIKNPLMAMKTAASLVIDNPGDPEVIDAFRRFVPSEIDRINTLVNGFVAYARPAADRPTEISVPELIDECLNLAHIAAKKSKIRFSVELHPLTIVASKDQVRQSIINLMINGIDAMELKIRDCPDQQNHMCMEILAYPEGDEAVIMIRDNGVGMTPEQCAQCIKPYFTTKQAGTGLGLSIVSRFVKDSGGTMSIESKLGEYTQVILRFRREHR